MKKKTSRISAFYKRSLKERLSLVKRFSSLSDQDIALLNSWSSLSFNNANIMTENVISTMPLPLSIATNFHIDGNDYLIPMATEEASVVAAACNAARLTRKTGGFITSSMNAIMIGQILLTRVPNIELAQEKIESYKKELIEQANKSDPLLIKLKGGAFSITTKPVSTTRGAMLLVHLHINVQDAMGANIVNTMAETIAPTLEFITNGTARLKIVANFSPQRIVSAWATWSKDLIGVTTIENILDANAFAHADIHRASTHNKGIMNGIDAVALATGNDIRALEAGAHSFAASTGTYKPLTNYKKNNNGDLVGTINIPLTIGTVGGIITTHPIAQIALKILGISQSSQLASIMAAVGLAQNFAALRALVTEGIQKGHMRLHAKNIAVQAGAQGDLVGNVAKKMIREDNISVTRAHEILSND